MAHQAQTVLQFPANQGGEEIASERTQFIDALYRDYHLDLLRFLRRLCGSGPPEAEDLVQAAFVRIARLQRFDNIQNPRAFLFKVGMNVALTSLKNRARTRRFLEELPRAAEIGLTATTPQAASKARDRYEELNDGISLLTAKQRELVIRNRIRGETYSEISTDTGWSPADISRTLTKAVTILNCAVSEA